jgi:hypothetical protein
MVFGVPLEYALKEKDTIPALLSYCFEAIEVRGIHAEGIYRVGGSKSEFNDLRALVELDVHAVHFIKNDIDIHLITGLVKAYLRDLPVPLLIFSAKDRSDYSSNSRSSLIGNPNEEERIGILVSRIKTLPREKSLLLRTLCEHLSIIVKESAINKMGISNLAMIFSAVLFHNQSDLPEEKANWFSKPQAPDLNSLDFMKADLVMEDLLKHYERVFTPPSTFLSPKFNYSNDNLADANLSSRPSPSPSPLPNDSCSPTLPTRNHPQSPTLTPKEQSSLESSISSLPEQGSLEAELFSALKVNFGIDWESRHPLGDETDTPKN